MLHWFYPHLSNKREVTDFEKKSPLHVYQNPYQNWLFDLFILMRFNKIKKKIPYGSVNDRAGLPPPRAFNEISKKSNLLVYSLLHLY